MRKRTYLVGAILGIAASTTFAGSAAADLSSTTFRAAAKPKRQAASERGGVKLTANFERIYSGGSLAGSGTCPSSGLSVPGCTFFPAATEIAVDVDDDFKYKQRGSLPQCSAPALAGKDAASARASCPDSVIGQGSLNAVTTDGVSHPGILTLFNGPTATPILEHADIVGTPIKQVNGGTVGTSPLGGDFGTRITFPTSPPFIAVFTHIDATINRVVVNKSAVKKGADKRFLLSARCKDKNRKWNFGGTSTFSDGRIISQKATEGCRLKRLQAEDDEDGR
jgi:hypothetical protein